MRSLLYLGGTKIGIIFLFDNFSMNLNLSAINETVKKLAYVVSNSRIYQYFWIWTKFA